MKIKRTISIIAGVTLTLFSMQIWSLKPTPPTSPTSKTKNKAFTALPGWENSDLRPSLQAFKNSCKVFLKQNPEKNVGNAHFSLKAKDWQPACRAAMKLNTQSKTKIKTFFQTWFKPVAVIGHKPTQGKFTGYYAASANGSRRRTSHYSVPVYMHGSKKPIWVASAKERNTLVIEGSASIHFQDGSNMAIEYASGSGSHMVFKETENNKFHGAQNVTLSPGYSMAVDRRWIPLGTPLWLMTKVRQDFSQQSKPFQRLMIAQDTGSKIRGAVRGDMYWGTGKKATAIAQNIRNDGSYWLLLPKKAHV